MATSKMQIGMNFRSGRLALKAGASSSCSAFLVHFELRLQFSQATQMCDRLRSLALQESTLEGAR